MINKEVQPLNVLYYDKIINRSGIKIKILGDKGILQISVREIFLFAYFKWMIEYMIIYLSERYSSFILNMQETLLSTIQSYDKSFYMTSEERQGLQSFSNHLKRFANKIV